AALELDRFAVLVADVHGRRRTPAEHAVEGAHLHTLLPTGHSRPPGGGRFPRPPPDAEIEHMFDPVPVERGGARASSPDAALWTAPDVCRRGVMTACSAA